MGEKLKEFDQITQADERWQNFGSVNKTTGTITRSVLQDFYSSVERQTLHDGVPEDVQDHFLTARHLALYSWFVYRFAPVAQLQAFASLEFALRARFAQETGRRPPGLGKLLDNAITAGLIIADRFSEFAAKAGELEGRAERARAFIRSFRDYCQFFRNDLAHGSGTLIPGPFRDLQLVADAINQLYPRPVANR